MHEIVRADLRDISEQDRDTVLAEFEITSDCLIGQGTDAEVYALSDEKVLKIYANASAKGQFELLRDFYASLDTSNQKIKLPEIFSVDIRGGLLVVQERRIPGVPLSELLADLPNGVDRATVETNYFHAMKDLGQATPKEKIDRYLVFDDKGVSSAAQQSWVDYLRGLITRKADGIQEVLRKEIPDIEAKIDQLNGLISFEGTLGLIHGDFFPGNVMVDPKTASPTGVVDFGTFTMFGDPLFDAGTGWSFYSMYGEDDTAARAELLPRAIQVFGADSEGKIMRYALAGAVLGCDLFVGSEESVHDNGHFRWSMDILKNSDYWSKAS